MDPTETFRQEATVLLDLGQRPKDHDLIDAAFRALHTIKGSGAMFGFDRVAAFTQNFETAFDLIRKGKIDVSSEIATVSPGSQWKPEFIRFITKWHDDFVIVPDLKKILA